MRRRTATLATVFTVALLGWAGSVAANGVVTHTGYPSPSPVVVTPTNDVFVGGLRQVEPDFNFFLGTGASTSCGDFSPTALPLGQERPWNLAPDVSDSIIWVASDQTLLSVDTESCSVTGDPISIPRAEVPNKGLAVDTPLERAYLANSFCAGCGAPETVSVVDLDSGSLVRNVPLEAGSDPRGIALSPDGSELYIAGIGDGKVWSLDTADDQTITEVASGLANPREIAFSPDGSFAYVTEESGNLAVIDTETRELSRISLAVGNSVDVAVSPDGAEVYVLNSFGSSISVISVSAGEAVASIPIPATRVDALAVSLTGDRAWVTSQADEKLFEVRLDLPINVEAPDISGAAVVGEVLIADSGTWSGSPDTYAYQWQRCEADGNDCASIPGADDPTYSLTGQDQGKRMRIRVTASNSAGSAEAFSAATDSVKPRPAARLSRPTIKGPARAKLRKPVTYRVTVKNSGDATATGVRLSIRGRGVSVNVPEGTIAPGKSRTVTVKVRFRKPGRIKATVKATSKNAAATQAIRQIRVVR